MTAYPAASSSGNRNGPAMREYNTSKRPSSTIRAIKLCRLTHVAAYVLSSLCHDSHGRATPSCLPTTRYIMGLGFQVLGNPLVMSFIVSATIVDDDGNLTQIAISAPCDSLGHGPCPLISKHR